MIDKDKLLEDLRYSSQWNAPCPEWAYRKIEAMEEVPDPIKLHFDHELTEDEIKNLKKKIADSPIVIMPSAQPEVVIMPSAQPEEVIPHRIYENWSHYWCDCGWHLGKKGEVKYCPDCGRKVKWDG